VLNPNSATNSLLILKILPGIVALFEKICEEQPILTVFSKSGRMYKTVVSVKCMM
jgi:hypothetical protein